MRQDPGALVGVALLPSGGRSPAPQRPASAAAAASPPAPATTQPSGPLQLDSTVVCFKGGTLLTAPHGKEVWREGDWGWVAGLSGRRLHRRELHTTELVLRLCAAPSLRAHAGCVAWNVRPLGDPREGLDPNYLLAKDYTRSPWHQALHAFKGHCAAKGHSVPVHWDIHGKLDRNGSTVEVGLEALRFYRPACYARIRAACATHLGAWVASLPPDRKGQRFTLVFPGMTERDNGFWQRRHGPTGEMQRPPEAPATLAAQGAALGLLSMQVELPRTVRLWAAHSCHLQFSLAEALSAVQREISQSVPAALLAATAPLQPATERKGGPQQKVQQQKEPLLLQQPPADSAREADAETETPWGSRPRHRPGECPAVCGDDCFSTSPAPSPAAGGALCWCRAVRAAASVAAAAAAEEHPPPTAAEQQPAPVHVLTGAAAAEAAALLLRDCTSLYTRDTEKPI